MGPTDINRACSYFRRGVYFFKRGEWNEAAQNLSEAVYLYPDHVAARMYLGAALAKQSFYLDAIELLEEGRQKPSVDPETHHKLAQLLGMICLQRRDYPAAVYYLRLVFDAEAHHDAKFLDTFATVLCKAGDFHDAFDLYLAARRQAQAARGDRAASPT